MIVRYIGKIFLYSFVWIALYLICIQLLLYISMKSNPAFFDSILEGAPLPSKMVTINKNLKDSLKEDLGLWNKNGIRPTKLIKYQNCWVASDNAPDLNRLTFKCGHYGEIHMVNLFNLKLVDKKHEKYFFAKKELFKYLGRNQFTIYIVAENESNGIRYAKIRKGKRDINKELEKLKYIEYFEHLDESVIDTTKVEAQRNNKFGPKE